MTATAADPYQGSAHPSTTNEREARLSAVLGRARRVRATSGEQWLFIAGGALVVAGLLCILVGWVGTSRTVLVAGQIPYVVSGGLVGLALVFLGGFLYFGHWVAVMAKENRSRADADRRDMALLREAIDGLSAALVNPQVDVNGSRFSQPAGERTVALVATPTGSMMHRPSCAAVTGRSGVRRVTRQEGLRACGICRPLDDELTL